MKPKFDLVTREYLAKNIVKHWQRVYGEQSTLRLDSGKTAAEVEGVLKALGSNPSVDAVNQVIGNESWTTVYCAVCRAGSPKQVVQVERHLTLCKKCLTRALEILT